MGLLLQIPWFKLEKFDVPLPFPIFGVEAIPLQPFGVLVAIGVLTALRVCEWFARRNGWSPVVASDFYTHAIGFGFLGAIVLNAIFYYPEEVWDMLTGEMRIRMLGLSSYGGFFGSIFGIWLWHKRRGLSVMPVADAAAFSFPFGWFFGRLGCFVVHDHPGAVTDFFLAVDEFRVGRPPYQPRHDLGLYEVIWSVACAILFIAILKRRRPAGLYVALLPMLYAPIRFFLDFLRAESEIGGDVRYGGLTPGQYSSIVFLGIGAIILRRIMTHPPPPLPPEVAWPPLEEREPEDKGTKAKTSKKKAQDQGAKAG